MRRLLIPAALIAALLAPRAEALVEKPADLRKSPQVAWRYPVLTAPLLAKAPVIDGVVDKAEWSFAARTLPFVDLQSGRMAEDAACCWLGYTPEALYVAFRFNRPAYAGAPKAAGLADAVWGDDSIEFFLRPVFGEKYEYNFVVNTKGVRAEGRRTGVTQRDWNAPWSAAARLTPEGYEGEMMVPFASLQVPAPKPGAVWEFLAVNARHTPSTELGASAFLKHWTAHEDFNYLLFGDTATPAVRPLDGPAISPTQAGLVLELLAPRATKAQVTVELLRAKSPNENFFRVAEAEANPLGPQVEARDREFVAAARVVQETLKRYEPVKRWSSTEELAADRPLRLPMVETVPVGDYLLYYQVAEADGALIAGGALPFRQTPAFTIEVEPYLLVAQTLAVICDFRRVANVPPDARVSVELLPAGGGKALEQASADVDAKARRNVLRLPAAGRLGKAYDLRAVITAGGKTVAEQTQAGYVLPPAPEWWGNDLGKVEVLGEVPKPWTPIEARADGFGVWGRQVALDALLMPTRITHTHTPMTGAPLKPAAMLAAPARLDLQAGGPLVAGPVETLSAKPWLLTRRVSLQGNGLKGALTLDVEFDGLMKYTLDLDPAAGPATLDRLVFELSVPRAHATHYNHGYIGTRPDRTKRYSSGVLAPEGLAMGFTEKLWLGNPTLGLDFVCERDRGWWPLDNPKATQVIPRGDTVLLRIGMVDAPRPVAAPLRFQWAILPTPAKPMNEELNHRLFLAQTGINCDLKTQTLDVGELRRYAAAVVKGGANAMNIWSFGQGTPPESNASLWNPDFAAPSFNPATPGNDLRARLLKDAIRLYHEAGLRWVTLYMLWHVPDNWPNQHGVYWREMAKHPLVPSFEGFLFEPGAAFNDWYLWEVDRTVRELDIDGMYQDSSPHREITANLYTGTGWQDEEGNLRGSYPVFATRELHKRVWVLFHAQRKKDGLVYSHNSHLICPVVESFCDVHHCGEGSAIRDPDIFVGKFYGYPAGIPVTFTRWNNPIYPEKRMHSWRTALILDIDLKAHPGYIVANEFAKNKLGREALDKGYAPDSIVVGRLWDVWRAYPWQGSVWHAPWDAAALVDAGHPDLKTALHCNPGKAAQLIVSNFSDKTIEAAVKVDLRAMGFDPARVTLTDVITPKDSPVCKDGVITLTVQDWRWRMLLIAPQP
jgi:hypothetical protein